MAEVLLRGTFRERPHKSLDKKLSTRFWKLVQGLW